jgi:hypothetical protein
MVFKHYDEINAAWEAIRTAMAMGELNGYKYAKCSTMPNS